MPRVSIGQVCRLPIRGGLLNLHLLTSPANVGWREVRHPLSAHRTPYRSRNMVANPTNGQEPTDCTVLFHTPLRLRRQLASCGWWSTKRRLASVEHHSSFCSSGTAGSFCVLSCLWDLAVGGHNRVWLTLGAWPLSCWKALRWQVSIDTIGSAATVVGTDDGRRSAMEKFDGAR